MWQVETFRPSHYTAVALRRARQRWMVGIGFYLPVPPYPPEADSCVAVENSRHIRIYRANQSQRIIQMIISNQQQVLDYIINHVNSDAYLNDRSVQVCTTSKYDAWIKTGINSTNRVVKALFEKGLVQYVDGQTEYKPRQEMHYLVPAGFQHNRFGCKVGDIWRGGQGLFWRVESFDSFWAVCRRINSHEGEPTMRFCPRSIVAMKVTVGEMVAHLVDTL